MVFMLAYSTVESELKSVHEIAKTSMAYISEEKLEITVMNRIDAVKEYANTDPVVNLACYDITMTESRKYLTELRKIYKQATLMIIASQSLSPMEYVKPDILASYLIIRPYSDRELEDKIRDMMIRYLETTEPEAGTMVFEGKDGKVRIPYTQILYMEARNKRIYIRLKSKEYAIYDTLEELEQRLPQTFQRCHRSYLVNTNCIRDIFISMGEIELVYGIRIPLSRSYKPFFKVRSNGADI